MECEICGGEFKYIGTMGLVRWYRCEGCYDELPENDIEDNRPQNSDTYYAGAGRVQYDELDGDE